MDSRSAATRYALDIESLAAEHCVPTQERGNEAEPEAKPSGNFIE